MTRLRRFSQSLITKRSRKILVFCIASNITVRIGFSLSMGLSEGGFASNVPVSFTPGFSPVVDAC